MNEGVGFRNMIKHNHHSLAVLHEAIDLRLDDFKSILRLVR